MDMTWKAVRNALDRETLLKRMGLEERTPAGDFFTGLGLMFAPKRGDEMRATLNEAWRNRGRGEQDYQRDLGAESGVSPSGHA